MLRYAQHDKPVRHFRQAVLDALSGVRVILGVGVGALEVEFRALGNPFHARGAVTDESTAVLKALWTEENPRFAGEHFSFSDVKFSPKPVQQPHPPIWIGGSSPAALRRAARLGDGWHPSGLSPSALSDSLASCHKLAMAAGRDPNSIAISLRNPLEISESPGSHPPGDQVPLSGTPYETVQQLRAYERLGCRPWFSHWIPGI